MFNGLDFQTLMVKKLIFTSNKSVVCMPAIAHPGVRNAGCKPVGKMANDCGGLLSLFMLQRSGIVNLTQQSGTEDRRTIACRAIVGENGAAFSSDEAQLAGLSVVFLGIGSVLLFGRRWLTVDPGLQAAPFQTDRVS